MPGVPFDAGGPTTSASNGGSGGGYRNKHRGYRDPALLRAGLDPRPVWRLQNREDYTPVFRRVCDVKFIPETNDIVVAEGFWPYSRLQVISAAGKPRFQFRSGEISPFGVAFNRDGHVIVTDHRDRTVKFYTTGGEQVAAWPEGQFEWPNGIAVCRRDRYHVADWSKGRISMHDASGATIRTYNTYGSGSSEFSCPEFVAVDTHGRVVMTDAYDHSVKVFDEAGQMLLRFGAEPGPGRLQDPRGVCVDGQANIYVADWEGSRVQVYSPDGQWLTTLLSGQDGLDRPWGLDITGTQLVCSEHKRVAGPTVKLYSTNGL